MKGRVILSLFLLLPGLLFAQQVLPVPQLIQNAYNAGTRDISGKPGPKYWQNAADYDLQIKFNPATREVTGIVDVVYFNNSPDTLKEMWFKLYPNLYKKGVERNSRIADADLGAGVTISEMQVNGQPKAVSSLIIEGTNMHTDIQNLLPGKKIKLRINYSYILNEHSPVRTGQIDSGAFFLAYFFPRIAVYDDVDGWNKLPYKGREEFYNDFCNFKAAITVPGDFVVWATGDLRNAGDVLNKKFAKRLKQAESSDGTIDVIDSTDLITGGITRKGAFNTWKFDAKNVTDFAFGISNHYVWQSSSVLADAAAKRRTRIDAVFNPSHKDYYEWLDFTRKTLLAMDTAIPKWPFPYAHETVFDGLDEMEYPMMVNGNWVKDRAYAVGLVDHEIFHTFFPFYVGINETKYAWMDEGWAAMGEWIISSMIDSTVVDAYGIKDYGQYAGNEKEKPVITFSDQLDNAGYSFNSYVKPGLAYLYLKDYLGDELFTKALHHYIALWHGKHPTPLDFFHSFNEGAGKNLNWFWQRWFFEDGAADLAIKDIVKKDGGYSVQIENKGNRPLPIDLILTWSDGSVEKLHKAIDVWEKGDSIIIVPVNAEKILKSATLGNIYIPDKNNADNSFEVK